MTTAAETNETTRSRILEFDGVDYLGEGETSIRLRGFSARIRSGELVEIDMDRHHESSDLVMAILGLRSVNRGEIRFRGEDWLGKDYARHFRMRSEIGRVFSSAAWVQSLTLRDNICLSMLHHGAEPAAAESRLRRWGERIFGCPIESVRSTLNHRPSVMAQSVLQTCQLVRAICIEPKLLILEQPIRRLPRESIEGFVAAVDDLRQAGTAVLIFADRLSLDELTFAPPRAQWQLIDDTLSVRTEETSS